MMEGIKSLIMLTQNLIMSIPFVRMLYQSTQKISIFLFLKIVEIGFKMKLQKFFYLDFFQVLAKLDFPYLSPYLSKWNESKILMFIKI